MSSACLLGCIASGPIGSGEEMAKKFGYVISFLITCWGCVPVRVSASRQKGSQIVTFNVRFVATFLDRLGPLTKLLRRKVIEIIHGAALASYPLNLDHIHEDGEMLWQPLATCQVRSRISFAYGDPNFGQLLGEALKKAGHKPRDCRIEGTYADRITLGSITQRQVDEFQTDEE